MNSFINFFLACTAVIVTPVLMSMEGHGRFFERPLITVLLITLFSAVISVILSKINNKWTKYIGLFTLNLIAFNSILLRSKFWMSLPLWKILIPLLALVLTVLLVKFMKRENLRFTVSLFSALYLLSGIISYSKMPTAFDLANFKTDYIEKSNSDSKVIHIVLDMFSKKYLDLNSDRVAKAADALTKKYSLTQYQNHFALFSDTFLAIPQILGAKKQSKAKGHGSMPKVEDNHFREFYKKGSFVYLIGDTLPYCSLYGRFTHRCRTKIGSYILSELRASFALYLYMLHPRITKAIFKKDINHIILDAPKSGINLLESFEKDVDLFKDKKSFYAYVHTVIPHRPFQYDSDCHYREDWSGKDFLFTGSKEQILRFEEQSLCVLKKVDAILGKLKENGVLSKSKVLIQSDHGRMHSEKLDGRKHLEVDISYASKIYTWTKAINQMEPYFEDKLTSNFNTNDFVRTRSSKLQPQKRISFFLYSSPKNPVQLYESSNGFNWDFIKDL